MNDYLAAKYLSGAKGDAVRAKQTSKKKRKHNQVSGSSGSGLAIVDAGDEWGNTQEEEEDVPMVVESRQKAGFKPVRQRSPTPEKPKVVEEAEDEKPTIVDAPEPKRPAGGLQTAAELAESTRKAKERETKKREQALKELEASQGAGETVYRDASGKARDTKSEKAEARRQRERELQKEMERMEWGKGLVQREDKQRRKEELEAAAAAPVARYANDERLNQDQKEQARWNDPMANMLSKPSGSGSRKKERPAYKGPPPPPNRFNIKPGYRWDGVDRSNGFERKYLQRGNAAKVRKAEAYAYSVDDM